MHWGNVGLAMLTLFQTATLEGWPDLMYQSLEVQSFSWIFFVVFIVSINANGVDYSGFEVSIDSTTSSSVSFSI